MDYALEETFDYKFTSRAFSTGIPTALASGTIEIYEDNGTTQITTAETLDTDFDGVVGLNNLRVVATAANGFQAGKSYTAILSVGTVGGVSVVGEVVYHWTMERSSAATAANLATAQADLDIITGTSGVLIGTDAANVTEISDAVWNEDATAHQTAGTFGEALGDPAATGESIRQLVGEFNAAAAVGDPSTAESLMQYIKQIVNILAGSTGIVSLPASAAPASGVNLIEMIGAIYDDTAAGATASALTTVDNEVAALQTDLNTLTAGVTLANGAITDASLAGNMEIVFEEDFATNYNVTRNAWETNVQDFVGTSAADPFNGKVVAASVTGEVGSVAGHTNQTADHTAGIADIPTVAEFQARTPTAAQLAYIVANAATGLPVVFTTSGGATTTAVINTIDGSAGSSTNDQYNGRLLVFTDGTLKGVVTDITDYVGLTTTATITAIPFAPESGHAARLI